MSGCCAEENEREIMVPSVYVPVVGVYLVVFLYEKKNKGKTNDGTCRIEKQG